MKATTASVLDLDTAYTLARRAVGPGKVLSWLRFKCLLSIVAFALNFSSTADAAVRYVNVASGSPVSPYTSWATAARTIQDAIDAASAGDEIVVTNGVYQTGGRVVDGMMTNRVAVTKPVTVRSVNGPEVTVIAGYRVPGAALGLGDRAVRCVYLGEGATLVGFTLTNGVAYDGGGVWCESANALASNCVLSGNSAYDGGGASGGTLNNCTFTGNSAIYGSGGGADAAMLNNCTLTGNSAEGNGGGASESTLLNCILTDNLQRDGGSSDDHYGGGGAYHSTLNNCMLARNFAAGRSGGGGAHSSALNDCTLTANSAYQGGGASGSTLNNCTLANNSGQAFGGGTYSSTLNNCTLTGNSSTHGGGATYGSLIGCVVSDNSASFSGGGVSYATLINCTVTGNAARDYGGGGTVGAMLANCIVYYNTAGNGVGPNFIDCTLNYSCTTPLPTNGVGNITDEPQLASVSHLSASSPCRGAGSAALTRGVDIDREMWATPPSIGCDEYYAGAVTGLFMVAIEASYTNVATGILVDFRVQINGRVSASRWEFDDGTVLNNQPRASRRWAVAGDYPVVMRAYNESYPQGLSATVTVHVVESPVHYVALNSSSPVAPYASWATAARNIQDAVEAAAVGGVVLVSNGVYQTGGRGVYGVLTNRVVVAKPLTVRSLNGPAVTVIRGYQVPATRNGDGAVRCVYLSSGVALVGFTLTNGATRTTGDDRDRNGGGVWCESVSAVVSNCTLIGNSAGFRGGGAYQGTLNNCTLTGNSASGYYIGGGGAYGSELNNCTLTENSAIAGGGAAEGTLNNCTLTGNSAYQGGGAQGGTLNNCALTGNSAADTAGSDNGFGGGAVYATLNNCALTGNFARSLGGGGYYSTLNNCIVYYNTAGHSGANYWASGVNYSCTTPLPSSGQGNFTSAPLFVDQFNGNLRLQTNSPCINAGLNVLTTGPTDLDGRPRIAGGTVDIGAYEFQSPQSTISYAWLQQYGLPTDGTADGADSDGDRLNNYQEWRAGTNPTNALSVLRLKPPLLLASSLVVTWESVPGRSYFLEGSTNLASSASFQPLAANIPGQAVTTTYSHTNAASTGFYFYRVGVE